MDDDGDTRLYADDPAEDSEPFEDELEPEPPSLAARVARAVVVLLLIVALLVYFVPWSPFAIVRFERRPPAVRPIPVAPEPTSTAPVRV